MLRCRAAKDQREGLLWRVRPATGGRRQPRLWNSEEFGNWEPAYPEPLTDPEPLQSVPR